MADSHALVLTGEVLPGFAPEAVWPQLAAYFRMEPQKIAQLVARAPCIIKQSEDLGKLRNLQEGIARIGARTEIRAAGARSAPSPARAAPPPPPPPPPPPLSSPPPPPAARDDDDDHPAAAAMRLRARASAEEKRMSPQEAAATGVWSELPAGGAIHAGFWRRCAALVLDGLIWIPIGVFLFLLLLALFFIPPPAGPGLFLLVCLGTWFWYFPWQESSHAQATFGKRALGIKVVNRHGEAIGLGRSLWRHFSKLLLLLIVAAVWAALLYGNVAEPIKEIVKSGAPPAHKAEPFVKVFNVVVKASLKPSVLAAYIIGNLVFYGSYMLAGWTRRKRTLYDMLSGVYVVFDAVEPGARLPRQRTPMPGHGWALNILAVVVMIAAAAAIPNRIKNARELAILGKTMEVMVAAETIQHEIVQHGCQSQAGERSLSNPALGKAEVTSGLLGVCTVTLTLSEAEDMPATLRGGRITLTREGGGDWSCSSDLPEKYLPKKACGH